MEAAKLGGQAYDMGQGFYTGPGLQLLQSQPMSFQTGQQMLGMGLGAIGAGTPQLFDTGAALNIGAANRANQVAAASANAQAAAARDSAFMTGGAGLASAGIGAVAAGSTGLGAGAIGAGAIIAI